MLRAHVRRGRSTNSRHRCQKLSEKYGRVLRPEVSRNWPISRVQEHLVSLIEPDQEMREDVSATNERHRWREGRIEAHLCGEMYAGTIHRHQSAKDDCRAARRETCSLFQIIQIQSEQIA